MSKVQAVRAKPKYNIVLVILIALLSGCFHSCNHDEVFYRFDEIKHLEWSKADTLSFHVDSALLDTSINYRVSIELAHNFDYPYRNIWFYVEDNISDTTFVMYGKQYLLADEYGKWYGSGFGALYQMSLVYYESIRFKEKRNYLIKVIHGMRDEPLGGIEKVGLKIEKIESEKSK